MMPGAVANIDFVPSIDFAKARAYGGREISQTGKRDGDPDLSQPALQHLAQDAGAVARQGRRARDRRVSEDALHRGAAEDAARADEDAGEGAHSQKGGGRGRSRSGAAVGGSADRGDGQAP